MSSVSNNSEQRRPKPDMAIFWPAMIVIACVCTPLILNPETGSAFLGKILSYTTNQMGCVYLWFAVASFGFLFWLATGKYGNVVLGDLNEAPEFSTMSWLGMLFCGGVGTGLVYWGTIEWAYYYISPPFGIEPKSVEAGNWAATYGMFHWGFTAWALYCVPTMPIAYSLYVRKTPVLRMSTACRGILGKHADGFWGKVIDIFFVFGLVGGVGTSLGLGTPMLSEGLAQLLDIERSFKLDVAIIIIWTIIFGTSVFFGLKKGIKILSDINVYLAVGLIAFIFIFGPTAFIISTFTNSVGLLLQNFIEMSFYSDPIGKSGFPQGWTIFYWAWWVAYAPYMGLFVARISKGRTIREVVIAECLYGTLGCWTYFAILGNTGLYFELNNILPVTQILNDSGAPAAIIATIKALPLGNICLVTFVILSFIFLATSLDSSAFILSSVTTKDMDEGQEPPRWYRVMWAVVLSGVALTLTFLGGLKALQTSAVVAAFPILFVIVLMAMSFLKWIKEDQPELYNVKKRSNNSPLYEKKKSDDPEPDVNVEGDITPLSQPEMLSAKN